MNKKSLNLKGMTLYEMIISIAIFAIMAGVLIGVGAHIDNTTRATNNLKSKIAAESPYAANKITQNYKTHTPLPADSIDVVVEVGMPVDMPDQVYIIDSESGDSVNYVCHYPSEVIMPASKYKTESVFTGSEETTVNPNSPNANLNLEFVAINPRVTTAAVGGTTVTTTVVTTTTT